MKGTHNTYSKGQLRAEHEKYKAIIKNNYKPKTSRAIFSLCLQCIEKVKEL